MVVLRQFVGCVAMLAADVAISAFHISHYLFSFLLFHRFSHYSATAVGQVLEIARIMSTSLKHRVEDLEVAEKQLEEVCDRSLCCLPLTHFFIVIIITNSILTVSILLLMHERCSLNVNSIRS